MSNLQKLYQDYETAPCSVIFYNRSRSTPVNRLRYVMRSFFKNLGGEHKFSIVGDYVWWFKGDQHLVQTQPESQVIEELNNSPLAPSQSEQYRSLLHVLTNCDNLDPFLLIVDCPVLLLSPLQPFELFNSMASFVSTEHLTNTLLDVGYRSVNAVAHTTKEAMEFVPTPELTLTFCSKPQNGWEPNSDLAGFTYCTTGLEQFAKQHLSSPCGFEITSEMNKYDYHASLLTEKRDGQA